MSHPQNEQCEGASYEKGFDDGYRAGLFYCLKKLEVKNESLQEIVSNLIKEQLA